MTEIEREKYRRPALEGFVRAMDEWYWNRTKSLVRRKSKELAILTFASIASSMVLTLIISFVLHDKYQ